MNHYFDDVFHRHVGPPGHKADKPKMRRSSTARSIGARSDFDTSEDGDHHHHGARSIGNSVATESPEQVRERQEADTYTAHYVSEQLSRVRSHQSGDFETGDEFEAQLDGQ